MSGTLHEKHHLTFYSTLHPCLCLCEHTLDMEFLIVLVHLLSAKCSVSFMLGHLTLILFGEIFCSAELQETNSQKNVVPLTLRMRAATATSLGAAAAHAKLLADQEEREIEHLLAMVIETQVSKDLVEMFWLLDK